MYIKKGTYFDIIAEKEIKPMTSIQIKNYLLMKLCVKEYLR